MRLHTCQVTQCAVAKCFVMVMIPQQQGGQVTLLSLSRFTICPDQKLCQVIPGLFEICLGRRFQGLLAIYGICDWCNNITVVTGICGTFNKSLVELVMALGHMTEIADALVILWIIFEIIFPMEVLIEGILMPDEWTGDNVML